MKEELRFEVSKLSLCPGDILAIRFPKEADACREQINEMMESLNSCLPDGVKAICYQDDVELSVITATKKPRGAKLAVDPRQAHAGDNRQAKPL